MRVSGNIHLNLVQEKNSKERGKKSSEKAREKKSRERQRNTRPDQRESSKKREKHNTENPPYKQEGGEKEGGRERERGNVTHSAKQCRDQTAPKQLFSFITKGPGG